jgi:hypothetical protein
MIFLTSTTFVKICTSSNDFGIKPGPMLSRNFTFCEFLYSKDTSHFRTNCTYAAECWAQQHGESNGNINSYASNTHHLILIDVTWVYLLIEWGRGGGSLHRIIQLTPTVGTQKEYTLPQHCEILKPLQTKRRPL